MTEKSPQPFGIKQVFPENIYNIAPLSRDFPELHEGEFSEDYLDVFPFVYIDKKAKVAHYYSHENGTTLCPILKVKHDLSTNEIRKKIVFCSYIGLNQLRSDNVSTFNENMRIKMVKEIGGNGVLCGIFRRNEGGQYLRLTKSRSSGLLSFERDSTTDGWETTQDLILACSDYLIRDLNITYDIGTEQFNLEMGLV